MHPLIEKLLAEAPVLADGGWGTEMQARGLPSGECPDAWNLSHAAQVEEIPRAYVEAGSRIVLTNTFRANRVALADYGLADQAAAIARAGVEISRRAAAGRACVFATLGPSGKMLVAGEVEPQRLADAFLEQAEAMADGGADALVVETMAELEEAKLALKAARETGLPTVACMVFDSGAELDRTMMGVTPEQAAEALTEAGADVIGANCGQGIRGYIPLVRRMRAATDRPLWIKANAGLPEMVDGQVVYRTSPDEFASHARELREAGADFIGGCCGTNPDFIRALAKELHP